VKEGDKRDVKWGEVKWSEVKWKWSEVKWKWSEVKWKWSEVKWNESEVVYIQGLGSSYYVYVATSYRLDGPSSFPGSILVFSVFFVFSSVVSCICFFHIFVFFSCIMRLFMYFLCFFCIFSFLCFVIFMYYIILWMFMHLYYENSCDVLCCFIVKCMVFVNTATGISPIAVNNIYMYMQ
jgi:hypothetical protein